MNRRDEAAAWWALIARVIAFLIGSLMLIHETYGGMGEKPILLLVAAGLMGPVVAASVAQVIGAWRGGGK